MYPSEDCNLGMPNALFNKIIGTHLLAASTHLLRHVLARPEKVPLYSLSESRL